MFCFKMKCSKSLVNANVVQCMMVKTLCYAGSILIMRCIRDQRKKKTCISVSK